MFPILPHTSIEGYQVDDSIGVIDTIAKPWEPAEWIEEDLFRGRGLFGVTNSNEYGSNEISQLIRLVSSWIRRQLATFSRHNRRLRDTRFKNTTFFPANLVSHAYFDSSIDKWHKRNHNKVGTLSPMCTNKSIHTHRTLGDTWCIC